MDLDIHPEHDENEVPGKLSPKSRQYSLTLKIDAFE
jgi:hypothetical protein